MGSMPKLYSPEVRIQEGFAHHSVLLAIAEQQILEAAKGLEAMEAKAKRVQRRRQEKQERRKEKKEAAEAAAQAGLAAKRLVRHRSLTSASCDALINIMLLVHPGRVAPRDEAALMLTLTL